MKVLVAPLDWGLGHATRCVPVIREFLRQGAKVELAVVKSNAGLLRRIFPNLRQHLAPSYNIVYPKHGYNMGLWLLKNGAHLNKVIRFERMYAEKMVESHGFDVLFSDNRFGFYSRKAKSIYMTHQRRIAFPPMLSAFEPTGILWHAAVMRHFDEVWVPDLPEYPGFAGRMSHVSLAPRPIKFVGALSRFAGQETRQKEQAAPKYKFVAVVSGVEPARSRFENMLKEAFSKIEGRHAIIMGRPALGVKNWNEGNVDFFTHLEDEAFAETIQSADWVVSRGGYSTIMDMAVLKAKCIFVPTPGQYEQVVLARDLAEARSALTIDEKNFDDRSLLQMISQSSDDVRLPDTPKNELLKQAVLQSFRKRV
ncbi:glycosyl transferase family 28 [Fibrobacter sp. UWH1]|nr:glycosyl transferase family 28 [Fibrobacter sp. UWH1]